MTHPKRHLGFASFGGLVASALLTLTMTGCSVSSTGVGLEVGFGPPALRAEVAVSAPGDGYVWVPGYYDWRDSNYVWVEGSWVLPPHRGAHWVSPRYDHRGRHHYYRPGRWD